MKQIPLTQGQVALVDDADYVWLSQWKWFAQKVKGNFYAARRLIKKNKKLITILMHRQILGLEKGDKRQGDHRNHNTLDNQRVYLRICTSSQNQMNRKPYSNTSSQFKGVVWYQRCKKWRVQIQINGKTKHLGYFTSEQTAVEVYNEAAKKYFGEFAYLN